MQHRSYLAAHLKKKKTQVVLNPEAGYESRTDLAFTRALSAEYPQLPYRRRKNEAKTTIHWGQRKLLMSEIEFLSMYARPGDVVLYVGAAPGTHTPVLIDLFPQLSFVLVDPAPFSAKLREGERVRLRQENFGDAVAQEYAGLSERLLFLSDVRSCDPSLMENETVEAHVQQDMQAQMRWHTTMRPRRSMLKFRLPWKPGNSEYLDGQVFLPVWGPITTTEARLITPEHSTATRVYDHSEYEQQMFFFNTVGRVARYRHDVDTSPASGDGLDYCYDCTAEIHILTLFLRSLPPSERANWLSLADIRVKTERAGSSQSAVHCDGAFAPCSDAAAEKAPPTSAAIPSELGPGSDEHAVELTPQDLARGVASMSRLITARLGGDRTLASANTDPEQRLLFIRSKQWVQGAPAYAPHLRPAPGAAVSATAQRMLAKMQGHTASADESKSPALPAPHAQLYPAAEVPQSKANTHGLGFVADHHALPPAARVPPRLTDDENVGAHTHTV
jgi:hypothetical protein